MFITTSFGQKQHGYYDAGLRGECFCGTIRTIRAIRTCINTFTSCRPLMCDEMLLCSNCRAPTAHSFLHPDGSSTWQVALVGGLLGEGSGFSRGWGGHPWQFFVVEDLGAIGGLVSTWGPPVWTEGSSQTTYERRSWSRNQLHPQLFTPPISLQPDMGVGVTV